MKFTAALFEYLVIYSLGSLAGWWLEFFYRGFVKRHHRIVNPGFLSGPYLPLYGTGAVIFYLIGKLPIIFWNKIILIIIAATFMELVTGYFFYKVYKIRLWDYTDQKGNFMGFICPIFSLAWGIIAALFLLFLFEPALAITTFMKNNLHYSFYFGLFYGVFLSDIYNSFNLAGKLSEAAKTMQIKGEKLKAMDYRELRWQIRVSQKKQRALLERYFLPFNRNSRSELEILVKGFLDKHKLSN